MELDFNDILGGDGNKKKQQQKHQIKQTQKKLTNTQTRARQQSCMISEVDKDLLPSNVNKPVQNFRVSLSDMLSLDKHDESLQNYKKNLLGDIQQQQLKQDESAQVEIIKVEIVSPQRPNKNILLDFQKTGANDTHKFKIKEGCTYCLRIHFKVKYDIVFGLKFVNNVYKLLAKVQKQQQKMGSYAPQKQLHVFDLPWQEAPSGFLARGDYKGKGLFLDNDGIVHCQFNYVMTIDKEW